MNINITKLWWFIRTKLTSVRYGGMGSYSYMGRPMFIQRPKRLFIGNKTRIYPGLRAEMTKPTSCIKIGDNVSIGQNFHIVSYDGELVIGDNTTISGNVFVSNVNHKYNELGVHILDQEMDYKKTVIGENCFIGYGAVILPGTILGKQCVIGANSVVKGEFPAYSVIAGAPAKVLKTIG